MRQRQLGNAKLNQQAILDISRWDSLLMWKSSFEFRPTVPYSWPTSVGLYLYLVY